MLKWDSVGRAARGLVLAPLMLGAFAPQRSSADVIENSKGSGTYVVTRATARTRDEVMESFAKWRNSKISGLPRLSIALWSIDHGVLSAQLTDNADKSSQIDLADVDLATLRESANGPWEIRADSVSDPKKQPFIGYLPGAAGSSTSDDKQKDSLQKTVANQALQDIYDLAWMAQSTRTRSHPATGARNHAADSLTDRSGGAAVERPPASQKVSPLVPLPSVPSLDDSCPYPAAAIAKGETGTVVMLVHVAPDGSALDALIEKSSGSILLDQTSTLCVQRYARFATKRQGSTTVAYWGRMRFNWTFGQ